MDAQQIHDLNLRVVTIWGQEVYGLLLGDSLVANGLQLLHGSRLCNANFCSKVGYRWCKAHPYDILNVDVIAEQHLYVVVDVNDTHKTVAVLTKIVKERRILPHR